MSIFTLLLDVSILNGYELHRAISEANDTIMSYTETKRQVAVAIVSPYVACI